jgi:hypothetical protein
MVQMSNGEGGTPFSFFNLSSRDALGKTLYYYGNLVVSMDVFNHSYVFIEIFFAGNTNVW